MNYSYFLWIPLTVFYNGLMCWAAVKYNQSDFLKTYLSMVVLGLIPSWSIAGYFSKNLLLDGLIYDMTLVVSGPFIMAYLGQAVNFTLINWAGVVLTITGLLLVRMHH